MSFSADTRGRPDPADGRAARRTARFLGTSVFVFVFGAVVAFSVYNVRRASPDGASAGSEALSVPPENAVGPPPGADLGPYLEATRQAVATAVGERLAVVSLKAYRTEADARKVVGDLPVVSLLVALPGRAPAATADLGRWVDEQKAAERAERDEIKKLIPTVEDPSFKKFYTDEVARLDKTINAVPPNLVFGVVVRALPPRLQALAASGDVRMVDVAPGETGAGTQYRGIRPEETAIASEPSARPL